MRPVVFDAGALIGLERRDARVLALISELIAKQHVAHVPAGVVAQVWRGSPRQHAISRLLRSGAIRTEPMSEDIALRVGGMLAHTQGSDVVDGHVVLLARRLNALVITSDPDDIKRLDPRLDLVRL